MNFVGEGVFENPSVLGLTLRQSTMILPKLLGLLNDSQPRVGQILLGREQGRWTQKDLRRLEKLMYSCSKDEKETRDLLRVLRKACAFYAAKERLNLPYPRIPVFVAEEQNPFRPNFAILLSRYEDWKKMHAAWLDDLAARERMKEPEESRPDIELLIVSAVLYGGLYNIHSILALVRAVQNINSCVYIADGRVHVDLWLSWHGIPKMELRRWQPDELSATLLARMRPANVTILLKSDEGEEGTCSDRELARRIRHLLRARITASGDHSGSRVGGLDRLMQAAQAAAMIELPATLTAYSKRKYISHSMSHRALQRMVSNNIEARGNQSGVVPSKSANSAQKLQGPPPDLEPEWLAEFRAAVPSPEIQGLRVDLAAFTSKQNLSPLVRRLAEFMDWMLEVRTPAGKVRTPGSVKSQVLHLGRIMGATLGLADPVELNSEELEVAYSEMFEALGAMEDDAKINDKLPAVAKERSRLAREVSEFHRFLMARHKKDTVESQMFLSSQAGIVPVDANPLTLEDYFAALDAIDTTWSEIHFPECRSIARILVILGFRCGLRRLEALFRLVEDMRTGADTILTIRPFGNIRLKSRNARRRIPLRILLTQAELQEVLAWREQRRIACADGTSRFLFGGTSRDYEVVPQSIFREINRILQRVTGDESMHFHQLRHSFASWTWLRLMLADMDHLPDLFPHLALTTEWLRQAPEFRMQIEKHDCATRKHAYLLAQLLGHGSPRTSMEHYVHFADWLLAAYLESSEIMRPRRQLILLASGKSRMTIDRWMADGKRMAVPCKLFEKVLGHQRPFAPTEDSKPQIEQPSCRVRVAFDFLREAGKGERPICEIQQQRGLDDQEASRFIENARYLASLRSGVGPRHRMQAPEASLAGMRNGTGIVCPRAPSSAADEHVVDRFAPQLEQLVNEQAQLVNAGLHCFAHRVWHNRSIVVFQNPQSADEARHYIEFLTCLGIARKDIRWFAFGKGERSRYLAEWKRLLGLNRHNQIERIAATNNSSDAPERWLGIGVRFSNSTAKPGSDGAGSFGFRFLMVMGFIAFNQK